MGLSGQTAKVLYDVDDGSDPRAGATSLGAKARKFP
jgi:hypothetical protein